MREHFCSIFPRRDQFIWKLPGQSWKKANGPLLDHQILGVMSDEGRGLFRGCYWSHKTRHAVLDIDVDSKYHQAAELQKLQEKLAAVGLIAKPYQSSDSGGWHLYLFFDCWEDSSQVEKTLKSWLKAQWYSIECGQLEVFPSGNALRLPLQAGFGWLDPEGNLLRRREEIRVDEALASFLSDLQENQRNWSEAKDRIESQISSAGGAAGASVQAHQKAIDCEGFDGLWNYGQIPERMEKARYYLDNGLTEEGQSHAAVYSIQHLLWFGDRGRGVPRLPGSHNDEKRSRFVRQWLEKNHNGKSFHVNRGNWRVLDGHIRRASEWRRQDHQPVIEYVPYMVTERAEDAMIGLTRKTGHLWTPADLERANLKREEQARERIRHAVQLLTDQGRRVTVRQLMRLARCCNKTIKRHLDILQMSLVVALPSVGGDIDLGGVGGVPALGCSGPCSEEKEFCFSEIPGDPLRAVVDNTGSTVLAVVAEESFLPSVLVGDSGQTELTCLPVLTVEDGAPEDLEPAASRCSAEAPPSPPLATAWLSLVADSALCLLSCADRQVAKVRESDGMEAPESLASPSRTQPSTGSKHWLGGSLGTCGLNGFLPSSAEPPLGPLHLNPREIFYKGSGSVLLQDGGSSSGRCLALGSVLGAANVPGSEIIDGQAGRVAEPTDHPPAKLVNHSCDEDKRDEPFWSFRYEPAHGITSTCRQCCVRISRFPVVTQAPKVKACRACRQLLNKHLQVFVYHDVRGPPKCIQRIDSQSAPIRIIRGECRSESDGALKAPTDGMYADLGANCAANVPAITSKLHVAVDTRR